MSRNPPEQRLGLLTPEPPGHDRRREQTVAYGERRPRVSGHGDERPHDVGSDVIPSIHDRPHQSLPSLAISAEMTGGCDHGLKEGAGRPIIERMRQLHFGVDPLKAVLPPTARW